jgi:hypothetical protein
LINVYASQKVEVRFWLIGQDLNKEARKEAKKAYKKGQARERYHAFTAGGVSL